MGERWVFAVICFWGKKHGIYGLHFIVFCVELCALCKRLVMLQVVVFQGVSEDFRCKFEPVDKGSLDPRLRGGDKNARGDKKTNLHIY